MNFSQEVKLSDAAAEAIARGLYAIAKVDGVHAREAALVASFLNDIGGEANSLAHLERQPAPEVAELQAALSSKEERSLFIKTALLLAWADGSVSAGERTLIEKYGAALGVTGEAIAVLEGSVKEYLLGQLTHLHNTDATRAVAQKLKV